MPQKSYFQFCPIAMAAEILESRWTMLILRELCLGSTRFNQIRRGVPRMSPTLLSKRLKEMEDNGLIGRSTINQTSDFLEYKLTPAGQDLTKVILDLGCWSKKHTDANKNLANTDAALLMWDIRRNLHPEHFPLDSGVVQIHFADTIKKHRNWWMIFTDTATPDVGPIEPAEEVNLYIKTDILSLTAIWLGYKDWHGAMNSGQIQLVGRECLIKSLPKWLGPGAFANVQNVSTPLR